MPKNCKALWTTDPGSSGVYVAFGRGMGYMHNAWMDVHGAGCQRSDPKTGDPAEFPTDRGRRAMQSGFIILSDWCAGDKKLIIL
jgi:hypothetical protein